MRVKLRSYIHVIIQFASIAVMVFYADIDGRIPYYFVLVPISFVLVLWAGWSMRKSTIKAMPEPGEKFQLITKGPYRVIRHPMYTSLFIFLTPLLVYNFNYFNIGIFLLFAVNQVLKLLYEEKLLLEKDPTYKDYMAKTWRLLPILF